MPPPTYSALLHALRRVPSSAAPRTTTAAPHPLASNGSALPLEIGSKFPLGPSFAHLVHRHAMVVFEPGRGLRLGEEALQGFGAVLVAGIVAAFGAENG